MECPDFPTYLIRRSLALMKTHSIKTRRARPTVTWKIQCTTLTCMRCKKLLVVQTQLFKGGLLLFCNRHPSTHLERKMVFICGLAMKLPRFLGVTCIRAWLGNAKPGQIFQQFALIEVLSFWPQRFNEGRSRHAKLCITSPFCYDRRKHSISQQRLRWKSGRGW